MVEMRVEHVFNCSEDTFWDKVFFDDEFNLLQVKLKNRFFGIYRPGQSGRGDGPFTAVWLFPFELLSRYLKQRYVYSERSNNVPILVLHPDAEAMVRTGELTVKKMDVFSAIEGRYDMILCFNLLMRNYFPEDQIARGIENLKNALDERGFLIMEDDVSSRRSSSRGHVRARCSSARMLERMPVSPSGGKPWRSMPATLVCRSISKGVS